MLNIEVYRDTTPAVRGNNKSAIVNPSEFQKKLKPELYLKINL